MKNNTGNKYAKYNWTQINVTSDDKHKLNQLVAHYSTASSKGVMSTILSRLINAEHAAVFNK